MAANTILHQQTTTKQRLEQWIADIRQSPYTAMFQPGEPHVSLDDVIATIPFHLWNSALIWRDSDKRINGEWFALTANDLAELQEMAGAAHGD